MRIAVIGAGNGGQAIAGYLASLGNSVAISERNPFIAKSLKEKGVIELTGALQARGYLDLVTTDASEAVKGAEVVMIVTTAVAHASLAQQLYKVLEDGQIVVLNPGRTGGALEFRQVLRDNGFNKRIYLAEAQTLVYACRVLSPGLVNIIGVKDKVYLSALPASDTDYVIAKLRPYYSCFVACKNVLVTSIENYGAVFHPSIVLFNAAAIERGDEFYFYRQITPCIADYIERLDEERIAVGQAYGIDMIKAKDWVTFAYDKIQGNNLCERLKSNPAYHDIVAPTRIDCRQITEDIPTGAVPLFALGSAAGVSMPLYRTLIEICSQLLNIDFYSKGRCLAKLGLSNKNKDEILKWIE